MADDTTTPYEAGLRIRRAVLGDAWVDKTLEQSLGFQRRISGDDHASCVERHLGQARFGSPHATAAGDRNDRRARALGRVSSARSRGIGTGRHHARTN